MAESILRGSDPSWVQRYLAIIDRDYPEIAWLVLSTALAEARAEQEARGA